jgi:hypothetical protein
MTPVPCPYVFPNGERCPGHIVRVEAFNADLSWALGEDGAWTFSHSQPRSQYHLFCSERGNHAGGRRPEQMNLYLIGMSDDLSALVTAHAGQHSSEPELPFGESASLGSRWD